MIQITNYSVRAANKRYVKGDYIKGLSPKEEMRLINLGYAISVEAVEVKEPDGDPYKLKSLTVDEAKSVIEDIHDPKELYAILEQEVAGKNRTTLVEFIEDIIEEVAGEGNDL